ncbi:Crp/Fnr family transcriptional regulator [uncultured Aquimarina sp.]|uniref:Crp/Fnr family transcriptional regulator n=1 Tax=uncultured Aquimarina sp. TaxID=575652 RepID=UPI00260B426D|nr:Crp/Fnr family transcriptional regulator [uncultured Aquimarina sp.]
MKEKAYQQYLDSYLKICPQLKKDELNFIRDNLSITQLEKRQFYLKSGQIQKEMSFVHQGLLKSYYIDKQGKKVTISFIDENFYAADYPSFIQQKPSKYYIETIEPTIMVNLSYAAMQKAYKNYKNFENYGRLIAEQILLKKQDRIESFLFENAEERYIRFIKKNQNILPRISVSDLSSYLGIERQSLTRIRKKLIQQDV